jgi:trimethylamine:corrinoid methyltransferase-like protein
LRSSHAAEFTGRPAPGVSVETLAVERQIMQSPTPQPLEPVSVLDTNLLARAPETVQARQCLGSANTAPAPPTDARTLTVRQAAALSGVVTTEALSKTSPVLLGRMSPVAGG